MNTKTRSFAALGRWVLGVGCAFLLSISFAPLQAAVQASREGQVAVLYRGGNGAGGAVLALPSGNRVSLSPDKALGRRSTVSSLALLGPEEGRDAWVLAADRPVDSAESVDTVGSGQGPVRELVLLRGWGQRYRRLPAPGLQEGRLREGAVLLTEGDRLVGLVWLEGDDRRSLAVKAAPWLEVQGARLREAGWSAPTTVAPAGPGSQLALTAAVLADGSWLVAWSAFDGTDDEILWSRRRAATDTWSAPARLGADNAVPDITPSLIATRSGALAAWSRYDGGRYRLFLASFEDEAFGAPKTLAGAGTMHPSFHRLSADPAAVTLLYLHAQPRGWGVMEVDADGAARRDARVPIATAAERRRPALLRFDDGVLRLSWSDGDTTEEGGRR